MFSYKMSMYSSRRPAKATSPPNDKGQLNGSMTVDDIFDMYAALLLNGFVPDTMLVHPMAWLMWVKDPVIREFAIQAGGGSFFAQFTGNPAVQVTPSTTSAVSAPATAKPVSTPAAPSPAAKWRIRQLATTSACSRPRSSRTTWDFLSRIRN